jgi:hypothetical protein
MAEASLVEHVDHLLIGAPDLDAAIGWVHRATGVEPIRGGAHPDMGTHNALLSLGGRQYLEVIAPDPANPRFSFHIDLHSLSAPRLVTWAAPAHDLDALATRARAAGLRVLGPANGSRARPDGSFLRWRTLRVEAELGTPLVDPVPFFIEWPDAGSHPAAGAPAGCHLTSLTLRHPDPARLKSTLAALGIEARRVAHAPEAGLEASLATPSGDLRLQG